MLRQLAGVVLLCLAGCTVPVTGVPVTGSRAHGTVTLAYEYGLFELPQPDYAAMLQQAVQRCSQWGYLSAQQFGGESKICSYLDIHGCWQWRVEIQYQCQTFQPPR